MLLLLGMGMPLPVVYILGASLIAPGLMEMGIPMFEAHLFIVFFSAMSAITPPVAVAAYTASSIAEADPMAIGWQAVRLAVAGFVVPFIFVYQPAILLHKGWINAPWPFLSTGLGLYFISVVAEGFFKGKLTLINRLALLIPGFLLLYPGKISDVIGFLMGTILLLPHFYNRKIPFRLAINKKR